MYGCSGRHGIDFAGSCCLVNLVEVMCLSHVVATNVAAYLR